MNAVVVGAGISGLAAAHHLYQAGVSVTVVADTVGGLIQTATQDGYTLECGPHTFPGSSNALISLAAQVGLTPRPVSGLDHRYLVKDHRLIKVSPFSMPALLGWGGVGRLLQEPWIPPKTDPTEETLADFVRRRLGPNVLTQLVAPLVSGIYAGDPEKLSASAAFPFLVNAEREAGSLIRFGLTRKRPKRDKSKPKRSALLAFPDGMGALPQALAAHLPDVRVNTRISQLIQSEGRWQLHTTTGDTLPADVVILATPPHITAQLLGVPLDIPRASVGVVHLGFEQFPVPLGGFGFLVPQPENLFLLGAIWASSLFPDRVPAGHNLMSVFVGGERHPQAFELSDEEWVARILADLSTLHQVPLPTPTLQRVVRWPNILPQYNLGHQHRIETLSKQLPDGVFVCGNYLQGIALNQCVLSGQTAAKQAQAFMQTQAPLRV